MLTIITLEVVIIAHNTVSYIHCYFFYSHPLPSMITQWMKKVFPLQNGNVSIIIIINALILVVLADLYFIINYYYYYYYKCLPTS